jgi:Ni/Co efflux regulator RcnB
MMKTKPLISALLLSASLACLPAIALSQQSYPGEENRPKQDMKNAGHDTKDAARDTGHGVKNGTQKAYHSTKRHTKHAAHRTGNAVKGGVNGAREGSHNPQ